MEPNMQIQGDQQAVAIQQGDEAVFDAVFRSLYAPLVRYAATLTNGDFIEAEDMVQQVFTKLWDNRAALSVQYSIKAYLYRMVHNTALNRVRSQKTRERYTEHQVRAMSNDAVPAPDESASELQHQYGLALSTLPPQCRQVFELSRFEELKYREIAEHLGISIKTVETQMGKALKVLRQELSEFLVFMLIFMT
jgi:RNA polymerase sigma-70 factor, ECF subfamily